MAKVSIRPLPKATRRNSHDDLRELNARPLFAGMKLNARNKEAHMSVTEQLNKFAASIQDSCIVVLADLSTGLALAAASDQEQAQERVDALAQRAKVDWKSREAQAAQECFAECGLNTPECVVSSDAQTLTVSVSAPDLGDEGLCISVEDVDVALDLVGEAERVLTSLLTPSRYQ